MLSALTFLLPADLFLKVGVKVSPKLADYDTEWKHLYVGLAYFTIDMMYMMKHYTLKLLSVGIPLSHPLGLFDFLLYTTLQQPRPCAERPMSVKFFSMHLSPTFAKYLHQFLGGSAGSQNLISWPVPLSSWCSIIVKCSVNFLIVSLFI